MIETPRLLLRPYRLDDLEAFRAMTSEPEVTRFLPAMSAEDCYNRLLRNVGHWALFGFGVFAVFERDSGRFLGETALADFGRGLGPRFDGHEEAGWVFTAAAHGKGYAYEAATAAHAWREAARGPARTVCIIDPGNAPSHALAAKLGYRGFGEAIYRDAPVILLERDQGVRAG